MYKEGDYISFCKEKTKNVYDKDHLKSGEPNLIKGYGYIMNILSPGTYSVKVITGIPQLGSTAIVTDNDINYSGSRNAKNVNNS